MIAAIWAQAANGVIGRDGIVPWRLPEDLAHFRELTGAGTVVMGRRTWDSLPPRFRPLPGRRNVVVTRNPVWTDEGAEVAHDVAGALGLAEDVWVIGGAEIYAAALPTTDRIELTELREEFDGDAYAPVPDATWRAANTDPVDGWHESSTGLHYRFRTLRRTS